MLDHWRQKDCPVIALKLPMAQAEVLHNLFAILDIEPILTNRTLLNGGHHLTEHLLWLLLDNLRQQLQI